MARKKPKQKREGYKLTVLERISLMSLLPSQSNLATMRIIQELQLKLSLSEEEHKKFKIKINPDGSMTWDPRVDTSMEIDIGKVALKTIRDSLSKADKESKLTLRHISLWDMFMEENE